MSVTTVLLAVTTLLSGARGRFGRKEQCGFILFASMRTYLLGAAQLLWLWAWSPKLRLDDWHFLVWLHNPIREPQSRLKNWHTWRATGSSWLSATCWYLWCLLSLLASSSSLRLVSTAIPTPFTSILHALLSSATASQLSTSAPPRRISRLQASVNLSNGLPTDRVPVASWP